MPQATADLRGNRLAWCLAITGATLAMFAFHGTLDVFFTQDDFWLLAAAEQPMPNRAMLGGALAPDYVRPLPTYWLPLCNIALFGLEPHGHHLILLLFHGVTTAALYRVLWLRFGSHTAASFGTAMYALCEAHQFTLGWIAGANDVLSACGFVLAILVTSSRTTHGPREWLVACWFLVALLSKEHAIVLPAAYLGSLVVCGVLHRDRTTPRIAAEHRRQLAWFAGAMTLYAALWIALTASSDSTSGALGWQPQRMLTVLKHSLLLVHPTIDCGTRMPSLWLLLPPTLATLSLALQGRAGLRDVVFGLLLWLLPAAIFAVTTRPADVQEYYAHFCVFGLALLGAQCLAALFARWPGPKAIVFRVVAIGLLIAYAAVSTVRRLDDVAHHRSPALYVATLSAAANEQIRAALIDDPAPQLCFLDTEPVMWWAMGKGAMIGVLFPDKTAIFDGYDDAGVPAGKVTDETTLVLRQVGPSNFEVVR